MQQKIPVESHRHPQSGSSVSACQFLQQFWMTVAGREILPGLTLGVGELIAAAGGFAILAA